MTPSGTFSVSKKVVFEDFDDELVIINLDSGNYYTVDGIGTQVWRCLQGRVQVSELVRLMQQRFPNGDGELVHALDRFLDDLRCENLIVPVEDGGPGLSVGALPLTFAADRASCAPPILRKYTDMQDFLLLDPIDDVDDSGWPAVKVGEGA